jgi:phage terminase small subunit
MFARELAQGRTATEAYELAGFRHNRQNASRLMSNDDIRARVAELQQDGAQRAAITVALLIGQAEDARKLAMEIKRPAAAVAAIISIAKLAGPYVERKERGAPGEFAEMNWRRLMSNMGLPSCAATR